MFRGTFYCFTTKMSLGFGVTLLFIGVFWKIKT